MTVLVPNPSQIRQREEYAQRELQDKENKKLKLKRLEIVKIILIIVFGILALTASIVIMYEEIFWTEFLGGFFTGLLALISAFIIALIGCGIYLLFEKYLGLN